MKVAYIIDSAGLFVEGDQSLLDHKDVFFLPLHIIADEEILLDDKTRAPKEITKIILDANRASTSQPGLGEIEAIVDEIIEKGYDTIVSVCIASGLSGTQGQIESVCHRKGINCITFDTKSVGPFLPYSILEFQRMIAEGKTPEEALVELQEISKVCNSYAVVDDLMYLEKGGRISKGSALVGTLLKVKPLAMCGKSENGKVVIFGKARTRKKAYEKMIDRVIEDMGEDIDKFDLYVCGFDAEDSLEEFKELAETKTNKSVSIVETCFAIGVHTGPNTVFIFSIKKQ